MPNQFLPRCAPIWGFPAQMTVADLAPSYQPDPITVAETLTVNTTSAAVSVGARGLLLYVTTSAKGATCNLELIRVTQGGDVSVKKWTGVSANTKQYAGNLEMVDLDGDPFKVAVTAISSGAVSVYAKVTQ